MMDENSAGCASEAVRDYVCGAMNNGDPAVFHIEGGVTASGFIGRRADASGGFFAKPGWIPWSLTDGIRRTREAALAALPAPTISQDVPAPAAVTAEMVADAENAWRGDCDTTDPWPDFIAAHLNAALSAATPLQSDLAAVETVLLIDELRGDQNADVSLCQDNRVMVSAGWTGMNYRGFSGATLLDSLRAASAARSRAALQGADNHE